jgi:hypothetical protein
MYNINELLDDIEKRIGNSPKARIEGLSHFHLCEFCSKEHQDCTNDDCENCYYIICFDCYNNNARYQHNEDMINLALQMGVTVTEDGKERKTEYDA